MIQLGTLHSTFKAKLYRSLTQPFVELSILFHSASAIIDPLLEAFDVPLPTSGGQGAVGNVFIAVPFPAPSAPPTVVVVYHAAPTFFSGVTAPLPISRTVPGTHWVHTTGKIYGAPSGIEQGPAEGLTVEECYP